MPKITPFLWFDHKAEEAAKFYCSIFKNSKILRTNRVGEKVIGVTFKINGQTLIAFNGGPHFKFTHAISLFVHCETQAEIDDYWAKLSDGGQTQQCGWLRDKFGVSWQIVPAVLRAMLQDPDPGKSKRVMEAMLKMIKLDIKLLTQAHEQG